MRITSFPPGAPPPERAPWVCIRRYGNEKAVGSAIAKSGVARDKLFVSSKVYPTGGYDSTLAAFDDSLSRLGLDYLDLYIIHWPAGGPEKRKESWRAMEELVEAGLVKEIGVCNFGCSLLRDLMNQADIMPAMLQIEMHPYLTQEKLTRFCKESGIGITAFSPLGAQSYFQLNMAEAGESLLENDVIKEIASEHQRSPAQVLLRWGIQRGTSVVPKTSNVARLRENIAVHDFELTSQEMASIAGLNRNRRFNDPGDFCESAFNTFFPIYE